MAETRIDFPNAMVPGARIVPVLLVAGVPLILVPAGVSPTTAAVSSGSLSSLWWPGTGSLTQSLPAGSFNPVRGWLDPREEFSIREEAKLLLGDVLVEALTLTLADIRKVNGSGALTGEVTEELSVREARVGQFLTADLDATDTTIPLGSSSGFPSSGIACVGRETLVYNSVSAPNLLITGTPGGRGKFGSIARVHRSPVVHRPLVTAAGPRHWQGRLASLWLAKLSSDGTTLTDPTLVYLGTVGAGVQMVRQGTRWSLPLDHVSVALTRKLEKRTVDLFGYAHFNRGIGSPLLVSWLSEVALDATDDITHRRGWHPDRESFLRDWNSYSTTLSAQASATLAAGRLSVALAGGSSSQTAYVVAAWDEPSSDMLSVDTSGAWTSRRTPPEACLHLDGPVHLGSALDRAKIPGTVSWIVSTPSAGEARLSLFADTAGQKGLAARILSTDLGNGNLLTEAVLPAGADVVDRERLTLITKRTRATLGLVARGDTALGALRAIGEALEELQGLDAHDVAVDWDGIAGVLASIPSGGVPSLREYKVQAGDSLLGLLIEELRLRGCALVVRRGLLSAARSMDFASTEPQRASVTEADVLKDPKTGQPLDVEVQDNVEPLATSILFELADGSSFEYVDVTRQDEFGDGKKVTCNALKHLPASESIPAVLSALDGVAQSLLGPRSEPYRLARLPLPPTFLHLDPGDVISLTHSSIPTWRGTRGLTDAPCQVLEVRRELFGGKARAMVAVRVQAGTYYGYAPAAPVAPGGISGAVVTFDTTTGWGPNGFCAPFDETGAAVTDPLDGFAVDDEVQLVEVDSETPATPESFSVVSIDRDAHTITLSSSPSGTFTALAASALKVMLRYVAYPSAAAQQRAYAFIADHTSGDLGSGGEPDRWAA